MIPVKFPEADSVYGADQPEYEPLPSRSLRFDDGSVMVTACWKLSWRERIRVLITGRVFSHLITAGSPQPQLLSTSAKWES